MFVRDTSYAVSSHFPSCWVHDGDHARCGVCAYGICSPEWGSSAPVVLREHKPYGSHAQTALPSPYLAMRSGHTEQQHSTCPDFDSSKYI